MKPDLTIIAGGKPAEAGTPNPGDLEAADEGTPADEQCIPLDALAMPDDQEQMANPEVGDVVHYTVEGKVSRIAGGNAYVEPTAVNGKAIEQGEEDEQPPSAEEEDAQQYSQLQDMANKQDQGEG